METQEKTVKLRQGGREPTLHRRLEEEGVWYQTELSRVWHVQRKQSYQEPEQVTQ